MKVSKILSLIKNGAIVTPIDSSYCCYVNFTHQLIYGYLSQYQQEQFVKLYNTKMKMDEPGYLFNLPYFYKAAMDRLFINRVTKTLSKYYSEELIELMSYDEKIKNYIGVRQQTLGQPEP